MAGKKSGNVPLNGEDPEKEEIYRTVGMVFELLNLNKVPVEIGVNSLCNSIANIIASNYKIAYHGDMLNLCFNNIRLNLEQIMKEKSYEA